MARRGVILVEGEPDPMATMSADVLETGAKNAPPVENQNAAEELSILADLDLTDASVTYDIRVYKATDDSKEWQYLFNIEPQQIATVWQRCGQQYGSGMYHVRVYQEKGKQKRVFANVKQRVLAPLTPAVEARPQSDMAVILAAMEAGNKRVADLLEKMTTRPQAPEQNPIKQFTELAAAIGSIVGAFPRPGGGGGGSGELNGFVQALSLMREMNMGGGGSNEDNSPSLWNMAEKLLDKLPELAALSPQRPAPRPIIPARPAPSVVPSPQPIKPQVKAGAVQPVQPPPEMQQQLGQHIQFLITRAKANNDPRPYAQMFVDTFGPGISAWVVQGRTQLFPALAQQMPEIATYSVWFNNYVDALQTLVQIEGGDEREGDGGPDAVGPATATDHYTDTPGESGGVGYPEPHGGIDEEWA